MMNKYIVPWKRQQAGMGSNSAVSQTLSSSHPDSTATAAYTVSPNYLGNPLNPSNVSANIPDSDNCSLRILNLPKDVTIKEIPSCFKGYGRVFATVINRPNKDLDQRTAVAKVIFFELEAAQILLRDSQFDYMVPIIQPNRIKTAESNLPISHSRVLIICGPRFLVNEESLTAFFQQSSIDFELETIISHQNTMSGYVTQEWRFGSYRAQAITAFQKLRSSQSHVKAGVRVDFGVDIYFAPLRMG